MAEFNAADIDTLAAAFYRHLLSCVTTFELDAIRRRNARYALADNDSCASHEFCDANMVMLDAFKECFDGAEPAFLTDGGDSDAGQASLVFMGAAWAKAKREALTDADTRKAQLATEYVARIGYDPFEDEPTTRADDVAAILKEHAEIEARGGLDG